MLISLSQPAEETKSSWIPSYSVSSQGSSPLIQPQQTVSDTDVAEIESLPAPEVAMAVPREEPSAPAAEVEIIATLADAAEPEPVVESTEPIVESAEPIAEPVLEVVEQVAGPVIVTPADEVPEVGCAPNVECMSLIDYMQPKTPITVGGERPKSPWTPSYSVTTQGNSPLASPARANKELEEVEQLPPPVQVEEKPLIVVDEVAAPVEVMPCACCVNSIVINCGRQTANDNGNVVEEAPARPWTPSYSVTTQGPGSDVGADEDTSKDVDEIVSTTVTTNGHGHNTQSFPTDEEVKKVSTK